MQCLVDALSRSWSRVSGGQAGTRACGPGTRPGRRRSTPSRDIARPAVVTERLSLTPHGEIGVALKTPYRVGAGFALGAKLCRPDAEVWLLCGDGAAGFSLAEFDTFVRHGIPVLAIVGNDGCCQIAREQVPL